jgi:hypothetical protein
MLTLSGDYKILEGAMAHDNREKPAVKTTIVGGRPPGSGKEADAIPHGIEILLKKAAIDESFKKILLSERSNAADAIGLTLQPVEAAMLKAIPESSLERIVGATKVQPKIKQAFMGYTAAVMLAALTAASQGIPQDLAQASFGIQPDPLQGERPAPGGIRPDIIEQPTGGIRPDIVQQPSPEDRQAAQYKAQSYMRIALRDENAPKGYLEIHIENWQDGSNQFMKIHLKKIESSTSSESGVTEGVDYVRRGYFMQEHIPVGEYLVEIGPADGPLVRSRKIMVMENQTAAVTFNIRDTNPMPSTRGIIVDIE